MIRALAVLALLASCDRRASITSCADDLRGVWHPADRPTERWMFLDHRDRLEAYPLFDDVIPTPGLEVAPRVLDLVRTDGTLRGDLKRRYMQRDATCLAKSPVRVTACSADTLELVLAEPLAPLAFAPCTWGTTAPSRREKWQREP